MPAPLSNSHILIVDDDRIMGELLVALLTHKGYRVTHANSGAEALQIVQQIGLQLEIILCDIHMPGLRGGELASELIEARKRGALSPTTLLFGMSGSAPSASEAKVFDRFLQKPFAIEDIAAAVQHARAHATSAEAGKPAAAPSSMDAQPPALPPLEERTFAQLRSKLPADQLRQLYEMTLDDVRLRLEHMAAAAQSGDDLGVRHEAHAIKGGCGMVGAFELQHLAAATEGGSALDTSALADFAAACQRLQRMLDDRL